MEVEELQLLRSVARESSKSATEVTNPTPPFDENVPSVPRRVDKSAASYPYAPPAASEKAPTDATEYWKSKDAADVLEANNKSTTLEAVALRETGVSVPEAVESAWDVDAFTEELLSVRDGASKTEDCAPYCEARLSMQAVESETLEEATFSLSTESKRNRVSWAS